MPTTTPSSSSRCRLGLRGQEAGQALGAQAVGSFRKSSRHALSRSVRLPVRSAQLLPTNMAGDFPFRSSGEPRSCPRASRALAGCPRVERIGQARSPDTYGYPERTNYLGTSLLALRGDPRRGARPSGSYSPGAAGLAPDPCEREGSLRLFSGLRGVGLFSCFLNLTLSVCC